MKSEIEIILSWHTALNTGDIDTLVSLVAPEVEVGGPRGVSRGAEVVREWFGRANIRLTPLQFLVRPTAIIVEEIGEWISPDSGEVTGKQTVASVFEIKNQLITRIMRYDNLETALKETAN